jgi:hypothetical protein
MDPFRDFAAGRPGLGGPPGGYHCGGDHAACASSG